MKLKWNRNSSSSLGEAGENLCGLDSNRLPGFRVEHCIDVEDQVEESVVEVEDLKELLRRLVTNAGRLREVEELDRRAFNGLHEASVVYGDSDSVEYQITEPLLAREDDSNAKYRTTSRLAEKSQSKATT